MVVITHYTIGTPKQLPTILTFSPTPATIESKRPEEGGGLAFPLKKDPPRTEDRWLTGRYIGAASKHANKDENRIHDKSKGAEDLMLVQWKVSMWSLVVNDMNHLMRKCDTAQNYDWILDLPGQLCWLPPRPGSDLDEKKQLSQHTT